MGRQAPKKRSWFAQLLFLLFIGWILISFYVVSAIGSQNFFNKHWANVDRAIYAFERIVYAPAYTGGSITLSDELLDFAEKEGIDPEDLRAIIAAALSKGIAPHHLLGLAKIESGYCRNIGAGIAYNEALARQDGTQWWKDQLTALKKIANRLGTDVMSIPGSIGAGAISCFQLMPSNWLAYGDGDFRDPNQAGLNAAEYLLRHRYKESYKAALRSYNPRGGQRYVDLVLAAAAQWEIAVQGATTSEPIETNWFQQLVSLTEMIAAAVSGELLPGEVVEEPGEPGEPPIAGDIVFPYPGSNVCGNGFNSVIGGYTHKGQDYCRPGYRKGPVYAALDCKVILARFIDRAEAAAITWSSSGNTVVCRSQLDGKKVDIIYGHLVAGTMPNVGQTLNTGDHLVTTSCSGSPREYCSANHLHLGVKVNGEWRDPVDFFGR